MKRNIIRCLVFASVLILLLSSCSQGSDNGSFELEYPAGPSGSTDMGGVTLVYQMGTKQNQSKDTVMGYPEGSYFSDYAIERFADVKKEYNVNIDLRYAVNSESCENFLKASQAGLFFCDVISGVSNSLSDVARIGMLYGISSMTDVIDYTDEEKWGNRSLLEVLYYEDDLYGVLPMAWPDLIISSFGYPMVVNETFISKYGHTDPRDYAENGMWNYDTFNNALEEYTIIEDGQTKLYGLAVCNEYAAQMFMHSNGDKLVTKNIQGKYAPGIFSGTMLAGMQEGWDIFNGALSYTVKTDLSPGPCIDFFIDGKSMMTIALTEFIFANDARIGLNVENFGVLPFPTGPNAKPDYRFGISESINWAIAFSTAANHPDEATAVISAMYEPFKGYETYDDIKEYMQRNYFFDMRDCDNLYGMFLNQIYNYFHFGIRDTNVRYITTKAYTVAQFIDKDRSKFQEDFDSYVMPAIRGIVALWGEYEID